MIKIIQDTGNERAFRSIREMPQRTQNAIRQAFYYIGKDLREYSQKLIASKNKSGRVYLVRVNGISRKHQSSAPGEAPANLTGNLKASLGFEVRGSEQMEFGSRAEAPKAGISPKQAVADYALSLEVGTSKMAARPYLKPAVDANTGNGVQHFERELQKEFCK